MCGQQVKGGNPAPLFCSGEASPGLLHPDVESSQYRRDIDMLEHVWRRATKMIQGVEHEDRLRTGAVQHGGEKAAGRAERGLCV